MKGESPFWGRIFLKGSPAAIASSWAETSIIQFNPGPFNSGAKASLKMATLLSRGIALCQSVAVFLVCHSAKFRQRYSSPFGTVKGDTSLARGETLALIRRGSINGTPKLTGVPEKSFS